MNTSWFHCISVLCRLYLDPSKNSLFLTCRTPEKLRNWKKRLFCKLFLTSSLGWDIFSSRKRSSKGRTISETYGRGGGGGGEVQKKYSRKGKLRMFLECSFQSRAPKAAFCKISIRGSKYRLEFSIAWERLNIYRRAFHSGTIFEALSYLKNFLLFS